MNSVAAAQSDNFASLGCRVRANQAEKAEWYFVNSSTCRKFRLGEIVGRRELLGLSIGGRPVYAITGGRVAGIQFDFWREEIILEVAP